ncbi:hypothetical protein ACFPOE_22345 [Caenimonas terrae]|uniref:Uncharacterized protein n=1 Tax=Caenimonas terrae TaxID=696074 RepID=A0ABW0NI29_9BURK
MNRSIALLPVLLLAVLPAAVEAALFRCGNNYQDRPCDGATPGRELKTWDGGSRSATPPAVAAPAAATPAPAPPRAALPTSASQEGVSIQTALAKGKGRVTISNDSGAEIWFNVIEGERNSLAWIPVAVPGAGLAPGKSRDVDAGRVAAGSAVQVNWWHQGDKKLSEAEPVIWGPDHVRSSVLRMP